jgi:hypothetical protein
MGANVVAIHKRQPHCRRLHKFTQDAVRSPMRLFTKGAIPYYRAQKPFLSISKFLNVFRLLAHNIVYPSLFLAKLTDFSIRQNLDSLLSSENLVIRYGLRVSL